MQFEILFLNGNPFKGKHGGTPVSEAQATVCKGQKSGLKAAGNSCAVNVSYPEPFMLSGSRLNARKMPIVLSTGYQVRPGTVLCIDGLFLLIVDFFYSFLVCVKPNTSDLRW